MSDDLLTLPHDLEAERAVLGAILVDNRELDTAQAAGLAPDLFFRDAHRRVYRALETLATRRSALDLVTVRHELERAGDLDEVGVGYLAALIDGVPRSMNLPHYVSIVQEMAQRRAIMQASTKLARLASAGEEPATVILDRMVQHLITLGTRHHRGGLVEGLDLSRRAYAFLDELAARRDRGGVAGVPTGFQELDRHLDGFQPGHLVIVGGRTSEGKSALALHFALASASCAFFSCEMEIEEVTMRELSVLARVSGWALRRGLLSSGEHARVSRALDELAAAGVAIDDTAAVTLAHVRAQARQRQVRTGLRLIVVDYMQLMGIADARRDATREQDVASLARGLKTIAKELHVPVVALSQFNRTLKPGERPTLAHLRESGELEQAANVVILIHRPDGHTVATEGDVHLIIAKNRGGPTGVVTVRWYPAETRFADAPGQGVFA